MTNEVDNSVKKKYRLQSSVIAYIEQDTKLTCEHELVHLDAGSIVFLKKGTLIDFHIIDFLPMRVLLIDFELTKIIIKFMQNINGGELLYDNDNDNDNEFLLVRAANDLDKILFERLGVHGALEPEYNVSNNLYLVMHIINMFERKILSMLRLSSRQNSVDKVTCMVKNDISRKWRLSDISDKMNMSEITLRKSLEKDGVLFSDLLTEIRMRESFLLILNTDHKISKVAEIVGYENPSYFIKKFKEYFNITPKQLELKAKGKRSDTDSTF